MSNDKTTTHGGSLSLRVAKEWTGNWREWMLDKGTPGEDVLKGFFIPIQDICTLAQNAEFLSGARFYMALTEKGEPNSVKVVLVQVDMQNTDIIRPFKLGGEKDLADGEDDQYTIYDVTSPCPPLCGPESPLFPPPVKL